MIRAVLLDVDGTLIDSNEAHVAVWVQVFREAGYDVAADAIRPEIGKGGDILVPDLLPDAGEEEEKRLADRHGELFKADCLKRMRPFPRAHDLVEQLHAKGQKVVIASSASQEELDHYVELLDIESLIHASTTIDDVDTSKPAHDLVSAALQKAGVPPEHAIMVGDTRWDIEAAAKAGVASIAVRSGGSDDAVLSDAVAIYDNVADLLARYAASPLAR